MAEACNDDFLQKCTENSITQLDLGVHGAVLSEDAVIDFCFGPHGDDNDPRHLTARFQCSADFIARLLEVSTFALLLASEKRETTSHRVRHQSLFVSQLLSLFTGHLLKIFSYALAGAHLG